MIKKISLTALLFIFIFFCFSMTALAATDVEWVEKQTVQLYWGDSVTVDDYVVKAEDFSNDSVFISISKDGQRLIASPLSSGMDIEYGDEIKVCAQKIDPNHETITENGKEFQTKNSNPYAELNISERGKPEFDIQVETDKDIYDSKSSGDNKIDVMINIENNGDAEAKDVVLTVDTAGMELLKGKPEYKFTAVNKDEALRPINLTLKTPAPWEDTDFNITARIACTDIKHEKFGYEGSKNVIVEKKWDLIVSKVFPVDIDMGETVPVSVTVRNAGLCDINNIVLNDSIVSGMHLKENTALNKTLSLKSGEKADNILKYTLIPEATGEVTFPPCIAAFTLLNGQREEVSSNNSGTVEIRVPDITITKTVDKQQLNTGDTLNVTITAQNNGNANLNVRVNDTFPTGAKLIRGETSLKQILQSGGGSMSINYTLQMNTAGEAKLPACKAIFTDLAKNSREVNSDTLIVQVGTPISLGANNTTKAQGRNESSQAENNSSSQAENNSSSQAENNSSTQVQPGGTKGNNGNTPGFDFIPSLIGFLVVSGLLRKRGF